LITLPRKDDPKPWESDLKPWTIGYRLMHNFKLDRMEVTILAITIGTEYSKPMQRVTLFAHDELEAFMVFADYAQRNDFHIVTEEDTSAP
jgi:hypothetical protein